MNTHALSQTTCLLEEQTTVWLHKGVCLLQKRLYFIFDNIHGEGKERGQ